MRNFIWEWCITLRVVRFLFFSMIKPIIPENIGNLYENSENFLNNKYHSFSGENDEPEELVDRNCACCRTKCKARNLYFGIIRAQNKVFNFVTDPLFDFFIAICILINTFLLCLYWDGMSEIQDQILYYVTGWVCLFILDCNDTHQSLVFEYFLLTRFAKTKTRIFQC